MTIGFITPYDSTDILNWSGTAFYIAKSLESQGLRLVRLGPLDSKLTFWMRIKRRVYLRYLRQRYESFWEPFRIRRQVHEIHARLREEPVDLLFSLHTSVTGYLNGSLPRVLWADCTFSGMLNYYGDYTNLCRENVYWARKQERKALRRADLLLFSSEWAANSAVRHYGTSQEKVQLVPFGANIECTRTASDIELMIAKRPRDRCRLLFMGKVWERKGGDMALAVAERLNRTGCPTELVLVGSTPPPTTRLPDYVKPMGFISKRSDEGRRTIDALFAESHFLIVPSRAEAFGVVFCEASSFGVPSLASRTGGIPSVVRDGKNGATFAVEASKQAYADFIREYVQDRGKYESLARSTFREYQTRLNWDSVGRLVSSVLRDRFPSLRNATDDQLPITVAG
jgi:glycosyltransferase involved in cell wall biosynthesis